MTSTVPRLRWLLMLLGCVAVAAPLLPRVARSQMYAHRMMIPVPLDDSARQRGLLPGFSYYADIERGWRSAGDDRAWDARLAGTIELWRFARNTAVLIGTADELVANSLKDGGFNPRGISWELTIGAVHRFAAATIQLDFAHYCRHAVDDIDPPGPAYTDPSYVPTQRTMSVNGPRLRVISSRLRLGPRIELRGAVTGERYQQQWDGRTVQNATTMPLASNSWIAARGAAAADARIDASVATGHAVYLRASGIDVFFAGSALRPVTSTAHTNSRLELGWHTQGTAGGIEVYGALESLFDDMVDVVPRSSHVVGIGIRMAERNQF